MPYVERLAEDATNLWLVLLDHLTTEGHTRVSDTGSLPVIHTTLAGVTLAQIGDRPGLAFFTLYSFLVELAVAAWVLFWIRPVPAPSR